MTRTFIAIELGDNVRAALEREILRLARVLPEVRWTTASGLHLTLAFLGELDEAQLAMATEATQEVAAYARRFELQLEGLGSFGPTWAPRVIWAGLAGDTRSLLAVQGKLARALEARGFPREERRFAPHLTLARLKRPLKSAALMRLTKVLQTRQTARATLLVEALAVMQSELLPSGARYTCLQACMFGEGVAPA